MDGFLFTSISAEGRKLVDGKPLTISFSTGGANGIGLNAGCNGMGGTPEFTGSGTAGTIKVGQIIGTMMACSDEGVMEQEQWYSKWLTAGVDYELLGDTLELSGDGVTVTFERTGPAESGSGSGEASVTSRSAEAPDASLEPGSDRPTPSADESFPATPATIATKTAPITGQPAPSKPGSQDQVGPPKVPEN